MQSSDVDVRLIRPHLSVRGNVQASLRVQAAVMQFMTAFIQASAQYRRVTLHQLRTDVIRDDG